MAEIQDLIAIDDNNIGRWPENMPFSGVNNAGRADEGILARWYQDTNGSRVSSNVGNALSVTSVRSIPALIDNLVMVFTANITTGGPVTLNLNGLGAKPIKRFNLSEMAAGDIIASTPIAVLYKLAHDTWFMTNAPAALVTNMFGDFSENAAPGNPAANVARLYAKDDGSSTILAYRDSAGVERPLAGGPIVQHVYAETAVITEVNSDIPTDGTIPQNTEGAEILTAAITLRKSTNRVGIRARVPFSMPSTVDVQARIALFRDSVANALTAWRVQFDVDTALGSDTLTLEFEHAPGTVGPITYRVRVGAPNTLFVNANGAGGDPFGGVQRATIVLEEIHV